jgi:hypothetical protein
VSVPKPIDSAARARLLARDIQRALKECDVEKAERLAREALKLDGPCEHLQHALRKAYGGQCVEPGCREAAPKPFCGRHSGEAFKEERGER